MMWHLAGVITRKELVENFRDRRATLNALLGVLMNPLLYIAMFGFLNRAFSEQAEQVLQLPVVGAERAPNLVAYLDQQHVDVLPAPEDVEAAILAGDADVVLVIPEGFGEALENGRLATVELWQDTSSQSSTVPVRRAEVLVQRYSQQLGGLRLLARGVSPAVVSPIPVQAVDVSPEAVGVAGTVLNLLPVIMLTAAFMGGFFMVVDMTAGERERESLEPLLLNPVPRWVVVIGKYVAALSFTIFATALATVTFLVLLAVPVVQEFTNIRVEVGGWAILTAVLVITPITFMAVALQMLISSYTRNVKEAQTYTQLLSMAGFLPALMLSILPIRSAPWMNFVPTIGQLFLINKATRGDVLPVGDVLITTGVTLLVTALALVLAIRLYNQEKIALIG